MDTHSLKSICPYLLQLRRECVLDILRKNISYWAIKLFMKLYLGQPCLQSGLSITLSWKYMYQIGLTIFPYFNSTQKIHENGKTLKCYVYFQITLSFKRCSILSAKMWFASFGYKNMTICSTPSPYTPIYLVCSFVDLTDWVDLAC